MSMDQREADEKNDSLMESVEVEVLPDTDDDEILLEDDDSVDDSIEEEDEVQYEPGAIPDGQLDATRLYLSEIGFSPLLTADEEKHYSRLALKGDEAARKKMIECNLRLVVKIASLSQSRSGVAGFDRRRQPGLDSGGGKIRSGTGFSFLHLCHLVDSPDH